MPISHCPCGILRPYADCCGRFHTGELADNAQKLVRARYTAYVLEREDYLLATWHPSTRPPRIEFAADIRWLGVDIRSQQTSGDSARVDFIARFRTGNGPVQQQHEISRFVREQGRWLYVDGEFPPAPTPFGPPR